MRYMLLINSEKAAPPPQASEMEAVLKAHQRFGEELLATKKMVHAERLRADDEASGFYLIECGSKSEAVEWAKKIPLREGGYVDVVPVWPM